MIDDRTYGEGVMAVGGASAAMTLIADEGSRVMVVPLPD
jgi:hypothetical protein